MGNLGIMASSIKVAATYRAAVMVNNPLMYLRLGESSGNPQDSAGTNHVTTVTGTPTYSQAGALFRDPNTAVAFNGTDGSFQVPDFAGASIGTTGVLTVEFWNKAVALDEGCPVAKTAAVNYEWAITTNPVNPYSYYAQVWTLAGVGIALFGHTGTLTPAIWHHVVVTFDEPNHTISWWIDGVAAGSDATAWTGSSANGTAPISIAQRGDGAAWAYHQGTIDEVAIYNHALTLAQVQAHYHAAGY